MMSQKLGFLCSVLCKWHTQATLIGKTVLPVLLFIRLVILGGAVWMDDEEAFECNAIEPGCKTACFDALTPLSLPRLWTLQLVLVLAPGLVFLCYLIHLTVQETQVQKENTEVRGHTRTVYLVCMVFVIFVEVGSNVVQWLLHGFNLPAKFECMRAPCAHPVTCFLPHAWEKTVFLHIMLTASSLSIVLNVVEAVCVLRAKVRRADGGKILESSSKAEESILSRLLALWHSCAGFLGKTVIPVLQLLRLIFLGAAVQPMWSNDVRDFVCDTQQPGCSNAAYNAAFPFTLNQYWTLQVALVLAPGLIYFSYLVHLLMREKQSGTGTVVNVQNLHAYLGLLSAVVLLEVGFAVAQPLIFGLSVPATVHVGVSPCPGTVDCHVSQSMEKSVFMFIMLVLACMSGLLTLVEMCTVLKTERPWMKQQENMNRESCCEKKEAGAEKDDNCMKLNI